MAFVPYGPSHWEALTVVVLVTWLLVRQGRIWERAGKLPLWRSWSGWAAV